MTEAGYEHPGSILSGKQDVSGNWAASYGRGDR